MSDIPIVGQSQKPWWQEAENLIWTLGPVTVSFFVILFVGLGWLPSPILTSLTATELSLAKAHDALASSTLKMMDLSHQAELHTRDFVQSQIAIQKGLRQICRNTARNGQQNEKCDEL